jgi:hypothetical protein
MRAALALSALLALGIVPGFPAWTTSVSAQVIPVLEPGTLVRIEAPEVQRRRMEGTVHAMDADRVVLLLAGDAARPVNIPLASLARLDVATARSRASAAARGVGIGGVTGAVVGLGVALVAIATDSDMEARAPAGSFAIGPDMWGGPSDGEVLAIFAVGGAVIGAAVGGLRGAGSPGACMGESLARPACVRRAGGQRQGRGAVYDSILIVGALTHLRA